MATKRMTIVIDGELHRKLLVTVAKKMRKEGKVISCSRVINDILRKSL